MTTSNTALRITELDFATIKANLKDYLRSQDQFTDFDFEGSGMSVLLDILAYNTHYLGFYLNMIGNEMFLDTAQLRGSVLSHAKMINYVPASRQGAVAKLNLVITPSSSEDQVATQATIDRYTRFLGEDIDGTNYNFVTLYSNTATKNNSSFSFANVVIKQGDVQTFQYRMEATNTKRRFQIPSANVDTSTLSVTVRQSSSNTATTEYTLAEDITAVSANSTVYFLEEDNDLNYSIYFGDNVVGKTPDIGSIITCTYLDTAGQIANNITRFGIVTNVGGFRDNVAMTTAVASYGGSDKETIESTRFRAPYYYTTQNRAVISSDYATLLLKDYPNISSVSVWGGEDNDPIVYGKVFISLKTKDNYYLTVAEKESIKEELIRNRNVMTIIPELVDPDYTYLLLRGSVSYNPSLTTLTSNQILALVRAAIQDYENNELNRFDSTFRKSRLQRYIENADKCITGSDIKVYLQKRIEIDAGATKLYDASVSFPIKKGDFSHKLYSTPQVEVRDPSGVTRQVYFEEIPSAETGIESISIVNAGKDYTTAPTISIIGDGSGATATAKIASGRITSITVTNPGTNYTRATISISGDGSEASATAKLENKQGTLRSYYSRSNGEKVIISESAGTINYETGAIEIGPIKIDAVVTNDSYEDDIFTINVPIDKDMIPPLRNRILSIDDNDPFAIQLEVTPE